MLKLCRINVLSFLEICPRAFGIFKKKNFLNLKKKTMAKSSGLGGERLMTLQVPFNQVKNNK